MQRKHCWEQAAPSCAFKSTKSVTAARAATADCRKLFDGGLICETAAVNPGGRLEPVYGTAAVRLVAAVTAAYRVFSTKSAMGTPSMYTLCRTAFPFFTYTAA